MTEPHDLYITMSISTRGWNWNWLCRTHTWRCEHHMMRFMTKPHYNVQKGLFDATD